MNEEENDKNKESRIVNDNKSKEDDDIEEAGEGMKIEMNR